MIKNKHTHTCTRVSYVVRAWTTIHNRGKKEKKERERREDKKGNVKGNMKERNVMKLHFVWLFYFGKLENTVRKFHFMSRGRVDPFFTRRIMRNETWNMQNETYYKLDYFSFRLTIRGVKSVYRSFVNNTDPVPRVFLLLLLLLLFFYTRKKEKRGEKCSSRKGKEYHRWIAKRKRRTG